MEFKGRIMKVFPVVSGTGKSGQEWKRQEFVFEYFEHETDRYSDKVVLSLQGDRIAEKDLHEGDECVIGFGHSVREWQGKWYNELRVYKVEKLPTALPKGGGEGLTETKENLPLTPSQGGGEEKEQVKEGDLPF